MFVRVDVLPNKLFRNTGDRWIEIAKSNTRAYLDNQEYVTYLKNEIDNRRIEIEDLSQVEQEEIAKLSS